MHVLHFVYTKLNPEESPWKKADFHTAFYPVEFLSKEDLGEIERRIYVPPLEHLTTKETVFYKEIRSQPYLFMLQTRNLPEERDMFGRGGIFLCHGFIFPPAAWTHALAPSALLELIREYIFRDRPHMLSSSLVDKTTGGTIPIEIPEERLKDLTAMRPPALETETQWRMVVLLNRLSRLGEEGPRVVLRGDPEKVWALMNQIVPYVPWPLRSTLSWDTQFDGGSLTFYPFQVVGYTHERPRGREALEIDLDTPTLQADHEFFVPAGSYERWLNQCRHQIHSIETLQKGYHLSLLLDSSSPVKRDDVLPQRHCFVSANREIIRNVFLKRSHDRLGKQIGKHVCSALEPEDMLELLIEDLPPEKLAGLVERTIIVKRLTPRTVKEPLPDFLERTQSPRMALIRKLWTGKPIEAKDLQSLDQRDALEFVRYLLLTDWAKKEWLHDLIQENPELCDRLLSSHETAAIMAKIGGRGAGLHEQEVGDIKEKTEPGEWAKKWKAITRGFSAFFERKPRS